MTIVASVKTQCHKPLNSLSKIQNSEVLYAKS